MSSTGISHLVFSFFACVYHSLIWLSIDFLKEARICTKVLYFFLSKYKYYLVIHFQCVLKTELNKQEWKWFCHKQRPLLWPWLVTLLHYMVGFYTWMLLVHFRGYLVQYHVILSIMVHKQIEWPQSMIITVSQCLIWTIQIQYCDML